MKTRSLVASSLLMLFLIGFAPIAGASDADDLKDMLNAFLAGVTKAETHDRFWADDLVYTSSRGTRTNKEEIMSGFTSGGEEQGTEPGPVFSAEDVQIQVYGDAAIVAFRLVATPPAGAEEMGIQHYLNTGTFIKRNGTWKAVAWQATIVPDAESQ